MGHRVEVMDETDQVRKNDRQTDRTTHTHINKREREGGRERKSKR